MYSDSNPNTTIGFLVFFVVLFLYLLPTIIAFWSHHRYLWPIVFLNLFAGWTGAAWLVAFVWACVE